MMKELSVEKNWNYVPQIDLDEVLRSLRVLLDEGKLTAEEFQQRKEQILSI